jgi:UDP-GlcNAc:undecaprenyl-phosphate/decaprenyl-phosphate GlcNAc-1-phosphate transferase
MINLHVSLVLFLGSFLLCLGLTPVVRRLAISTGQVAVPKDTRWHKQETALLGGVAIFASVMPAWIVACLLLGWEDFGRPYLPVILCASGMFVLGLVDDLVNMDPQHKLTGQIILASIVVYFGFQLEWTTYKAVNVVLSILWIVGITNAFNLLDNMDGLSAGVAFIAGIFTYLLHSLEIGTSGPVLLLTASYLGALLGFLIHNFNPAAIFMGDAGSLFIGFTMACLTLLGGAESGGGSGATRLLSVMAIPILIVFIPILDTGFVSLMRKLFGRPISQGGKDHSSHRLVAIGFSERKAVLVLYGFSVASGLIALAVNYSGIGLAGVIIVLYLLFVLFFWVYLGSVKVYPNESTLPKESPGVITPILVQISYRRRLFEVLLDFVLITVAYYLAYLLRFEGHLGENFTIFLKSLPIMCACQLFSFYVIGVYKGIWSQTSILDLFGYAKAITMGTIMTMLILLFGYRFYGVSRTVFIVYWVLMLILVGLSRLSFRLLDEGIRIPYRKGERTLIYGAGLGGQLALKEIGNNSKLGLQAIGFLDDNSRLHGRKIQGYPVLGGREDLEHIVRKHDIKKIIVSFKEKGEEKVKEIRSSCVKTGMEVDVRQMKVVIS